MEIGKLNHRICILENRTITDGIGNHITKWEEVFSVWACVTSKNVTESSDAGVTKEEQTLEFLVRQNPSVFQISSTNFCICFRGQIYDIIGITPFFDHNSYMKIQAVARKAGVPDVFS